MPRKSTRKAATNEDAKDSTVRRSGRSVTKGDAEGQNAEKERSRRSSTAAQTAASVADSRPTRSSRNSRTDSTSPSGEGRSSGVESPALRVKSSRRSTGRINYKESDGEEDISTPKNEEVFDSNDEFDESDSDEKNKQKQKRTARSPAKPRATKAKTKSTRSGRRGRPAKKKDEETEEHETVEVSDENSELVGATTSKKSEEAGDEGSTPASSRKRARIPPTPQSSEKPGRRSSRSSPRATAAVEPVNKRPSRNRQVKKYTEVDEDFSDVKSDEDDDIKESEPEAKRETSRKRKRESENEPTRRSKREKVVVDVEESSDSKDVEVTAIKPDKADDSEVKKDVKPIENVEDESSDEPMEIDESRDDSVPQSDAKEAPLPEGGKIEVIEKNKEVSTEAEDTKVVSQEVKQINSEDVSKEVEKKGEPEKVKEAKLEEKLEKESIKEVTAETKGSSDASGKVPPQSSGHVSNDTTEKSKDTVPDDVKSQDVKQPERDVSVPLKTDQSSRIDVPNESKQENSVVKSDNTFLSKEPVTNFSVNGEEEDVAPSNETPAPSDPKPSFPYQNSTPKKTNGSHEEQNRSDSQRTLSSETSGVHPVRKYVFNSYIGEDFRSSLAGKTFKFVSHNVSSFLTKDKFFHELGILKAGVLCLQGVTKSLFQETLESKFDVLGYKAVTSWTRQSDTGLVTFYKASVFRLCKTVEVPVEKLISHVLSTSNLEENDKLAVSRCFDKCGNVLITQLASVLGNRCVTIANVKIPPCSVTLKALQVSCLTRKIGVMAERHVRPDLICGEFNIGESEVPYQILRKGYLTDNMIQDLKSRVDSSESAALVKLIENVSQTPSCAMSSCYGLVLGKELQVSSVTSPDLLWVCHDNFHTIGVLDVSSETVEKLGDSHIQLKADVAFSI